MNSIYKLTILLGLTLSMTMAASKQEPTKKEQLVHVAGSTKKICQLTGDVDRSIGQPTLSETTKRFGVVGTDLGSSFEHKGKLYFLFGDTWGRPGDGDAVAWTTSRDPAKIKLDFFLGYDDKWLAPTVHGIRLAGFEVPSGGISVNNKIYVAFTTDWSPEKQLMGRSVMAASEDDGKSWKLLYDLSKGKFINVSFWKTKDWLYIFGSGDYRRSSVYLARIKAEAVTDRSQLSYFKGVDDKQEAQWATDEGEAKPLFIHNEVGEFSVSYCEPVKRYVMMYNAGNPRGITMRSSETPWGPWSEGQVIFDPWRDKGYGHFMHIPLTFKADRNDTVHDPGRENEWGGEYGPYIMSRYTTGDKGTCRVYFTMSTWNPYQVVVMQTDLKLTAGEAK